MQVDVLKVSNSCSSHGQGCAYEEYDFSQVDKCSGAESGVFELETN